MEKRFMLYPIFTVRCSLRDLAPYDEKMPWSSDTVAEFQKMTENQVSNAKLATITAVFLYYTNYHETSFRNKQSLYTIGKQMCSDPLFCQLLRKSEPSH